MQLCYVHLDFHMLFRFLRILVQLQPLHRFTNSPSKNGLLCLAMLCTTKELAQVTGACCLFLDVKVFCSFLRFNTNSSVFLGLSFKDKLAQYLSCFEVKWHLMLKTEYTETVLPQIRHIVIDATSVRKYCSSHSLLNSLHQWFSTFVRLQPSRFFFYKRRAWYNWCQGPVLGRGPAVEKHWSTLTVYFLLLFCTHFYKTSCSHLSRTGYIHCHIMFSMYWF
jgi:hypothetical protein